MPRRLRRLLLTALFLHAAPVAGQDTAAVAPDTARAAPLLPDTIRGLYVNRWAAISGRMWELIRIANATEVNALVIDVKDDRGLLLYRSQVPLARVVGADTTNPMSSRRLRAVMDTLRAHGIHPIARIVVAKDPLLASARPAWAIRRRQDTSAVWRDRAGNPWLDPTREEIWQYAAAVAREAVAHGFAEIQYDYVRFPDEDNVIREGRYAALRGRTRAQVIRDQLTLLRDSTRMLGAAMSIDVFGLTATDSTDMGIGQQWEMFVDRADVVLPMNYPSHFAPGTYGLPRPNAQPYETMDRALRDAIARSEGIPGAARIIPWLQDFTLGRPRYGVEQVRAQMQAAYDNGIHSWILWNPGSRYTVGALAPAAPISEPSTP